VEPRERQTQSYTGGITVEQLVRVRNEFDAHHHVYAAAPDRPRCARNHGHHWTVDVTKLGRAGELEEDVALVLDEMADRSINEMFPTLDPTPEQLATLICERLILRHPTIIEVAVGDGRLTGITRNTPR
jgi:6-pyruvoyl-tetrahydropterin synthase